MSASQISKRKAKEKKIKLTPTGIEGLDEPLGGGLPRGRAIVVLGSAGEGKTVFLNEFLYQGITKYHQNGVFVTGEENPEQIMENVYGFGWDYEKFIKDKKLTFVDLSPSLSEGKTQEYGADYDCKVIVERIKYAVKKVRAKRVVIDAIGSLFSSLSNADVVRRAIYDLCDELRKMNITTLISVEKARGFNMGTRLGVEEFVADGVIELQMVPGQQEFMRKVFIKKIRGIGFRTGIMDFDISEEGLKIYPKIPKFESVKATNYKIKKKTGVERLDKLLGGGLPQGHTMLISGNTGTGKTTLALQYIAQGLTKGEKAVYVNMEEPKEQIIKEARAHGWHFDKFDKEGKIKFVNASTIDTKLDRLLYAIMNAIIELNATLMVFDSISTLFSDSTSSGKVRQFLDQLSRFLKSRGVTSMFTYLSNESFGANSDQLLNALETNQMKLSSIVDGIILLLYVERDQTVSTLMNVLKVRGVAHDKGIYEAGIKKGGFFIGGQFKA